MAAVSLRPSSSISLPSISPAKKGDINQVDGENCTQLYHAVKADDPALVSDLIANGASPFVGKSPFLLAHKNPAMILRLLNLPPTHELGKCKNAHEMMNRLFPRHIALTPAVMREAQKNVPPAPAMLAFLKEKTVIEERDAKDKESTLTREKRRGHLETTCSNASPQKVVDTLLEVCPLFRLAWNCAKLTKIVINFKRICGYNLKDHSLDFCPLESLQETVRQLVTHTVMSLHRETHLYYSKHIPHREDYAVIQAFISFQVELETQKILQSIYSDEVVPTNDLAFYWEQQNKDPASKLSATRDYWDLKFFSKWARAFPDVLQARLSAVNVPPSSLYEVVKRNDLATARRMISEGAALTSQCLIKAKENVPMLLVLIGAEKGAKHFQNCRKLHHICARLFKKIDDLEPILAQLQKKPTPIALVRFKQAMKKDESKPLDIKMLKEILLKKLAEAKISVDPSFELQNAPLDFILNTLLETSPLFREMYLNARSPLIGQSSRQSSPMEYIPQQNLIQFGAHSSFESIIESIIFGTFLALQDPEQWLLENCLSREVYAVMRTHHDYQTLMYRPKLMQAFFGCEIPPTTISFSEFWKLSNTPKSPKDQPPTERYRRFWDNNYFAQFLAGHPDFIAKRCRIKA